MQSFSEISIDLTAQELGDPPNMAPIEVDDICEFELPTGTAANTDLADNGPVEDDDTIEIELTVEQMDAVLRGRPIG